MKRTLLALALGSLIVMQPSLIGQSYGKPVSIIQLIAVPQKFNGRVISVNGLLTLGEHPFLFMHEEDAKHMILANAVRIKPSKDMEREEQSINQKYVTITGTFRAARTGTESWEGGAIVEIQSCTVWSDPQNPRAAERPSAH